MQAGVEVVVEQDHRPVAVIKTSLGPGRKISECIALAKAYENKLGYAPVADSDFPKDVQAAIDAPPRAVESAISELSYTARPEIVSNRLIG